MAGKALAYLWLIKPLNIIKMKGNKLSAPWLHTAWQRCSNMNVIIYDDDEDDDDKQYDTDDDNDNDWVRLNVPPNTL